MKRKKGAVHILACDIFHITTLTKSKFQNMRYTNKSEAMYMSAVAAFFKQQGEKQSFFIDFVLL